MIDLRVGGMLQAVQGKQLSTRLAVWFVPSARSTPSDGATHVTARAHVGKRLADTSSAYDGERGLLHDALLCCCCGGRHQSAASARQSAKQGRGRNSRHLRQRGRGCGRHHPHGGRWLWRLPRRGAVSTPGGTGVVKGAIQAQHRAQMSH